MSNYLNNIFNFSRPLPPPFDTLKNKKVKVSSKYSNGATETTLCSTVIKAVNAICHCMDGSGEGAVGIKDTRCISEYKSSMGPDEFHLIVYESKTGSIMGGVYNRDTELMENYVMNSTQRDGAAVMMAMFPILMDDEEFKENFEAYYKEYSKSFANFSETTEYMAYLCDNAYRRIKDPSCSAHVKVNIDTSGKLTRLSKANLDAGTFEPSDVMAGEFTIFAKTAKITVKPASDIVPQEDFVGKYELQKRVLTQQEQALVPKLPEWYVIPQEVIDICAHASKTTGAPMQMRNFLLRGPAGTGKTMGAKAIAAGLNLPYMKFTCSANTEIYDFVGQIFPDTENGSTGNAQLDLERQQLKAMGGINYANVCKLMNFPDLEDMDYDPQGVYQALTGMENSAATSRDCMQIIMDRVTEKVRALSKRDETSEQKGQSFSYIETDFIKALKYGFLIEVQEPTVIVQPGVLVGLNSLLEQEGSITLPTGEVIQRHPDAVVVVTTNVTYEGCRGLNQSIIDRMSLVRDIELPTPEIMVQRAMNVTGATDELEVSRMVQVVCDMAEFCRKNSISDGNVGMRSLIDWIVSSQITGDVYKSALYTIISKATSDEEDRETLVASVLEPIFAPKKRKKSV